tara:strand:- start:71 stop:553 length:483 start_codon:yes stop_codon:yes gene_type:complete
MMWTEYYKDLPIPSDWENVSYGNDELPSFACNGYQIWINSPILAERQENYLGIGFKDLSKYEDWIYTIKYERDYAEDKDNLLYTNDFSEVIDFVKKPTLYGLVGVLEYEFNYGLPFRDWEDKEVIQFIQDFLNGKTEYKIDDKFPKEVFTKFLKENENGK